MLRPKLYLHYTSDHLPPVHIFLLRLLLMATSITAVISSKTFQNAINLVNEMENRVKYLKNSSYDLINHHLHEHYILFIDRKEYVKKLQWHPSFMLKTIF